MDIQTLIVLKRCNMQQVAALVVVHVVVAVHVLVQVHQQQSNKLKVKLGLFRPSFSKFDR